HYARVALAELLFGEPQTGVRGWASDRGQILVRYGRPATVWQIPRNDQLLARPSDPSQGHMVNLLHGGGRWIFWNYDPERPSFIFEKKLGFSGVRHMFASISYAVSEEAKALQPTTFRPPFHRVGEVPHQLARFRAADSTRHEVEVYARAPVEALVAAADDSLAGGLFIFRRGVAGPLAKRIKHGPMADGRLSFRIVLPPGVYSYSIEAASAVGDAAAVSRGEFDVGAYSAARLRMSDLLLATSAAPLRAEPRSRHDLAFEPLPCLALPHDRRLAAIFEIYGLTLREGIARYRVTVNAGRAPGENVILRVLSLWGLHDPVRREPDAKLSFERELAVTGDRAVDWFELLLPELGARGADFAVSVTDLATGETARATRTLRPDACGG
ncbi:MAG: hypothetical protein HY703_05050, partial [Gemmatimonadetes bacterium]|nr:hypothetical protein [Gemmatimonadota bacterium]